MIRILKGNHREAYFLVMADVFSNGIRKLCTRADNNCYSCLFPDVCADLKSAEEYCLKIIRQPKS